MYQLNIDLDAFLTEFWHKKPTIIKQGFKDFVDPISPEELAGLTMEEEIDSRFVSNHNGHWKAQHGPKRGRSPRRGGGPNGGKDSVAKDARLRWFVGNAVLVVALFSSLKRPDLPEWFAGLPGLPFASLAHGRRPKGGRGLNNLISWWILPVCVPVCT